MDHRNYLPLSRIHIDKFPEPRKGWANRGVAAEVLRSGY